MARNPGQRAAVTVRPWWQITGAADRYILMLADGWPELLYLSRDDSQQAVGLTDRSRFAGRRLTTDTGLHAPRV